jgi:predicted MPP superfamily phosphohydrolase
MNKLGFLIFFFLYTLINFYIFWRGRQALPKDTVLQTIYSVLFVVIAFGYVSSVFLEGKVSPIIIAIGDNVGGIWIISLIYFLSMVILADVLRLGNHFFGIFPEFVRANYQQVKLIYFSAVLVIFGMLFTIGYIRFSNPVLVNLNIEVNKGIPGQKPLNIIAVSDLHLGDMIRKKRLARHVEMINKNNPDLILIAGDLFDRNLHTIERQQMDVELRKLKATYGVYAILGNHEYYGNLNRAIELIKKSDIQFLRDTAVTIDDKFILVGRDDRTNHRRKPLSHIVENIRKDLPVILLDHQPYHLKDAVENNIDLQFSGHTHNGQIFPFNKIVARMYELGHGYKKTGNTHFYVSSGLGLWGAPIRIGTQSEIVKIKMDLVKPNP